MPKLHYNSKKSPLNLDKIESYSNLFDDLAGYYSKFYRRNITRKNIIEATFLLYADQKQLEWAGDIWDIELNEDELRNILNDFDFNILSKEVETDDIFSPSTTLILRKVLIKSKGLIWVIHKNDKDPFPSNPHAHCVDRNLKLDLSNGNCYRNRKYITRIHSKDLVLIREKALKVFEGNLPPLSSE